MEPELPTLEEISASFGEYQPDEIEEIHHISEYDIESETLQDTTPMLLDLLDRGTRLDNLGRAMEMLQHNFWDLIGCAQFALAATILGKVRSILEKHDPAMDPFRSDLTQLAQESVSDRVICHIIQLSYERRTDPQIIEGFYRYMSGLGDKGIVALIEALGAEEDMHIRRFIIELLAELGKNHIHILGSYIDDPRWYLVRNMVHIMARIHSPDTLPYLRLTFIHSNPKVRAETVRALGLIGGYEATNALIHGLQSSDELTRMLCIRWLGKLKEPRVVLRLVNMLEEKEAGAENLQIKKEIILSLGEIGAPETYDVLKQYRSRTKLLKR